MFRTKADEAYHIGKGKSPVAAYLGIDEIIALAKSKGVDAIHPGYGFLSENADFAKACENAGIEFIGPTGDMMNQLGDKIQSKIVAEKVGVPTIPGVEKAIESENMSASVEHISHWLSKYDKYSVGQCTCRKQQTMRGEGSGEINGEFCMGMGDMAEYCVDRGMGRYISY